MGLWTTVTLWVGDNILKTKNTNIGSIPDNKMLYAGLRPQELRS